MLCVLGHSVILALSMYWLKVLCSALGGGGLGLSRVGDEAEPAPTLSLARSLSAQVLCSAGVRGLLVFRKPERARSGSGGGAAGGFSFGADMGRNAPSAEGGEAKAAPPAAPGSPALSAANGAPVTAEELAEREAAAEFTRRTRKVRENVPSECGERSL